MEYKHFTIEEAMLKITDRVHATLPGPELNHGVWISNERFSE